MTRQTWTALVAAVLFVALAGTIAVVPVPFVSWSPGGAQDTLGTLGADPMITVADAPSYPTSGRLDLTTVSVTRADAHLTLPEAVLSYWLPSRDALPRDTVYDPGKSAAQVDTEEADLMETAQDDAVVAALRAARLPVRQAPVVSSVTLGGPAHDRLLPGDLIVSVDGRADSEPASVGRRIRRHKVGQVVSFVVLRNREQKTVRVRTVESPTEAGVPVVGIAVDTGYRYRPRISFDLGHKIGGPSAGLVFALAIYDKLTPGQLLRGRHVAGTGEISPAGRVGKIGGIQEKIAAAGKAGATVFLVPAPNCADLAGLRSDLTLIKVATLADAVAALDTLAAPGGAARVPHC